MGNSAGNSSAGSGRRRGSFRPRHCSSENPSLCPAARPLRASSKRLHPLPPPAPLIGPSTGGKGGGLCAACGRTSLPVPRGQRLDPAARTRPGWLRDPEGWLPVPRPQTGAASRHGGGGGAAGEALGSLARGRKPASLGQRRTERTTTAPRLPAPLRPGPLRPGTPRGCPRSAHGIGEVAAAGMQGSERGKAASGAVILGMQSPASPLI